MSFEELEHTADIRMKITASGFCDLIRESGFVLSKTLYGDYAFETPSVFLEIEAVGRDRIELIVNFLSELLFLTETEYIVPMDFSLSVKEKERFSVLGTVSGVLFSREKHAGGIGVKGISYSGISLEEKEEGFELIIIFDI